MLRNLFVLFLLCFGCQMVDGAVQKDQLGSAPLRLHIPTDVKIVWEDCGEVNAGYAPSLRLIVMCNELNGAVSKEVQRVILAHEMAHAYFDQYDIPFTGSEEAAADELAYVALTELGDLQAIMAIADFYYSLPGEEGDEDADHPNNKTRATIAACAVIHGGGGKTAECPTDPDRIKHTWDRIRAIAVQEKI